MKFLPFLLLLAAAPALPAQQPAFHEQDSGIVIVPDGDRFLRWHGHAGRSYFVQVSDANNPLAKWLWAPVIESGNDEEISHEVGGTAERGFFRLKYTSMVPAQGETLDTADFDQDSLSNLDEIDPPLPLSASDATDPLNADTDGDGMDDGFERTHGLDPNDDGTGDPDNGPAGDADGDGLTNAAEVLLATLPNNPDTDADGLNDGDEITRTADPKNPNTDGDSLDDGIDADPKEILVDWEKAPESSYVLIDVAPSAAGIQDYARDLNDNGEVLFGGGIWAGENWTPKIAPELTGTFPGSISPDYPNGIGYRIFPREWSFFNNARTLLCYGLVQPTDGPGIDSSIPVPVFWPEIQSTPSQIYETADLWEDPYWSSRPLGVSVAGDMIFRTTPFSTPVSTMKKRLDRFDASGTLVGTMDGEGDYHPDGQGGHGEVSPSGWVSSNLARAATDTQPADHKVGLWNASSAAVPLPIEADGWGYPVTTNDLPNSKVVLVAGQWSDTNYTGRVFLPDAAGNYQYVTSLSSKKIYLMAGDGTAITSDAKLWRNGTLTPLRDLCPGIGELIDQGYSIYPLKGNKHGTFLIQAQNDEGHTLTKLLQQVRFELRDSADFEKGWDNTNPRTPWTSCGVNRQKADGSPWPNSLVRVIIPGCTEPLGRLLELVEYIAPAAGGPPPAGGDGYVNLTDHAIEGPMTQFNIQGTEATPANGCSIIVRQKTNPANRSDPLNVHVFPPRVVKFQVYAASPAANGLPGFVPPLAAIKAELNTAFNEQANIRFQELSPDVVPVNEISGVFNGDGNLPEAKVDPLRTKISQVNQAQHLKIILVKSLVPNAANGRNHVGLADRPGDWAIVETQASTDVYSHEAGHALGLTVNLEGDGHEHELVNLPNGSKPLMFNTAGNSRWIRRQDWKAANIQAGNELYGNGN